MGRPRKREPGRLSEALSGLRVSLGLTQEQLAERLGVSLAAVAMAETSRTPTLPMIAQLHRMIFDAAPKAENGLAVLTAHQRELDDILYRHLVQHSEAHRMGLASNLQAEAMRAIQIIVDAAVSQQSMQPALDPTQTAQVFEHLRNLSEFAGLLRPDLD